MVYPQELETELRTELEHNSDLLAALEKGDSVEALVRIEFHKFNLLSCKGQSTIERLQVRSLENRKEVMEFREFQETVAYWKEKSAKLAGILQKLEALRVFNSNEIPFTN